MGFLEPEKKLLFIDRDKRAVCFRNRRRASNAAVDQSHLAKELINGHGFNCFVTHLDLHFTFLNDEHRVARLTYFK